MPTKHFGKLLKLTLSALLTSGMASAASYCTAVYGVSGTVAGSNSSILFYDQTSGAVTSTATTNQDNLNAQALQPTNGLLYMVDVDTNYVYSLDPVTRTTTYFMSIAAHMTSGEYALGGTFSADGFYWVSTNNGRLLKIDVTTKQVVSTFNLRNLNTNYALVSPTNGDLSLDTAGQAYMLFDTQYWDPNYFSYYNFATLYKLDLTTGKLSSPVRIMSGGSYVYADYGSMNGLAIDPVTGKFYLSGVVSSGGARSVYELNPTSGALTFKTQSTDIVDLSSCNVKPDPPVVTKGFSPNPSSTGKSTLTITITNPNPAPIYVNSDFADNFTTTVANLSASGLQIANPSNLSGSCDDLSGNTVTAPAGGTTITLAKNAQLNPGSCTIVVDVVATAGGGVYTNNIPAGALDTTAGSTTTTTTASLTYNANADLAIQKTGTPTAAQNGAVTYTIKVWNNGPNAVKAASITDTVPGNLTGVTWSCAATGTATCSTASGSGNSINLNADLAVDGGSTTTADTSYVTLTVSGTATTTGDITNTATVSAPSGVTDTSTGNNTSSAPTTIKPAVDVQLTKTQTTPSGSTVNEQGQVSYTIKVWNAGPSAVTGVNITDAVPSNLTGVTISCAPSGSATCGTNASSGNNVSFTGAGLPVGSSTSNFLTISVTGTAILGGTNSFTNTATASVPGTVVDTNTANNSATTPTLTVKPVNDLAIQKTQNTDVIALNGTLSYTIKVWNNGPSAVNGASIQDTVPSNLTGVSWTCAGTGGATCSTASGSGNTINLNAYLPVDTGSTSTADTSYVTITVTGTGTTRGNITNTATVTAPSSTSDTVSTNNTSSVSAAIGTPADIEIKKTENATTYNIGDTVTYKIYVYALSAGASKASANVTISDTVPSNLTNVTWTCDPLTSPNTFDCIAGTTKQDTSAGSGNTISIEASVGIGSMTGNRLEITVTGRATTAGVVSNTASVVMSDSSFVDTNTTNDTSSVTANMGTIADLAIQKTGPATAAQGETITYSLKVWNNGPTALTGAVVQDVVPTSLMSVTGVSCAATGTAACGTNTTTGNTVKYTLGNMAAGSSNYVTITVTGKVSGVNNTSSSQTNTASVTVNGPSAADSDTSNNSSQVTTSVTPAADLSIVKSGPATAIPGQAVTYTLTITNNGPSSANGASFLDNVPTSLTNLSASCGVGSSGASGCTATVGADNVVTGSIATLPSSGSMTVTITGTVPSSAAGTLNNTATVTAPSGVTDFTTANNTSGQVTTTLTPRADLQITKTDGVNLVDAGGVNSYTITVTNAGPSDAGGAVFADTVPDTLLGVTWTCASSGGALCPAGAGDGNTISQTIPTFPAGSRVTYTVSGTVARNASGNLTNTATISAPTGVTETNSTNNSAADTDSIVPLTDLIIQKLGTASAPIGGTVTYTIKVWNLGPNPVTGASIADTVPSNLTGVTWSCLKTGAASCSAASGSGNNISLTANLPVDTDGTNKGTGANPAVNYVTITVTGTATTPGQITNTATVNKPSGVNDGNLDNNTSSATTTLAENADLSITKVVDKTYAKPGETLTYTLTLSNAGPTAAKSVTVTDTLPAGVTYLSSTPAAVVSGQSLTWTLGDVPMGSAQSLTVKVTAPGPSTLEGTAGAGTQQNTVSISSPTSDPVMDNNAASASTSMVYAVLAKSVRNVSRNTAFSTTGTGLPGEVLEYCIAYRNYGGAALPNFSVTDNVPGSTTPLTTAYDAAEPSDATGFGVKVTRNTTVSYLTSADDTTDKGSLSTTGGTFGSGVMLVNLGTVAAGEQGSACFQVKIK